MTREREPSATLSQSGAPPRDAPAVGPKIDRYEVRGLLGAGGMGIVYRAIDVELRREVAIKLVRGELADAREQQRLLREAQTLARLRHPNIIPIYDVGTVDDDVFVVMPYLTGGTLGAWMRASRRTWNELRPRFLDAARGLAAAHAIGLVHRDFKPDNVLLGKEGEVLVADFGLARPAEQEDAAPSLVRAAVTRTTGLAGTPLYMAPEQIIGDRFDARADQFAFCVALWEALYGIRPFSSSSPEGDTLAELYDRIRNDKPRPSDAAVPGHVRDALAKGLAFEQHQRFASLDQLVAALSPPRRTARVVAGIAALVIAALAIGVGIYSSTSDPPRAVALPAPTPAIDAAPELPRSCDDVKDCEQQCRAGRGAACTTAARNYRLGWTTVTNSELAATLDEQGCALGELESCIEGGIAIADGPDTTQRHRATAMFVRGCKLGSTRACGLRAYNLAHGYGEPANPKLGAALLQKACDAKDTLACWHLAFLYRKGIGVAADPAREYALLVATCELDDAGSCSEAGTMAIRGEGIRTDVEHGKALLQKGCDHGSRMACRRLAKQVRGCKETCRLDPDCTKLGCTR